MISFLRGTAIETKLTSLVLDVNGIGYEVMVAPEIASTLTVGDNIEIFTSLVVREDSWTLYGFRDSASRFLFEELQGVTGIGPKVAHSLIAFYRPDELKSLIATGENAALERVPGIGKKVASRIILELKDRFSGSKVVSVPEADRWRESVLQAMTGLGYSEREAERAIEATTSEVDPTNLEISELLRLTLMRARASR